MASSSQGVRWLSTERRSVHRRRLETSILERVRSFLVVLLTLPLFALPAAGGTRSPFPNAVPAVVSTRWGWPLAGRPVVLRDFAPPSQPWLAGHRGADLAATPGAEVYAAGAGTIGYAGPLAGRAVVTVLHSDGLRTTYLPVHPSVRRGQTVSQGEAIGVVQDLPGHCRTACLHWGLLRGRSYLDPLLLLGRGQVRLLPLWPSGP